MAISKTDLETVQNELKIYMCALTENLFDRLISRMNDFHFHAPGSSHTVKHHDKDPPYCANPGCDKRALSSDGTTPGYPDGTFFLYCEKCSEAINDYRNDTTAVPSD